MISHGLPTENSSEAVCVSGLSHSLVWVGLRRVLFRIARAIFERSLVDVYIPPALQNISFERENAGIWYIRGLATLIGIPPAITNRDYSP